MKGKKHSNQIDMLNGSLLDKIFKFALPLAASSILQQLFNSADVAVVGRFAGSEALAAVGGNASVISLLVNLFVGLSVGANVTIAGYIGQQKKEKAQEAVHTAMGIALISGVFLIGVGMAAARPILEFIDAPSDVIDLATVYLRIYFAGMPFLMLYNFGAAVLRSVGDTKRPLYCLTVAGVINVCLNLLLVIRFELSVVGVGAATVAANAVSAGMVLFFLSKEEDTIRLDIRKLRITKQQALRIIKIGAPAGIQGVVFSISNVCIQSAINGFGTNAVAGSAAALNYEFFTYFVTSAFCQAAVTFTSQNYGAGKYDRCRKVFRLSLLSGIAITGIMCIIFVLGRDFFVGIYTSKPADIEYGLIRIVRVELLSFMPCLYEISGGALRGMGNSMLPAVLTVFGSCILRIIWVYTLFPVYGTFEMLLAVYPFSWIVTGTLVLSAYFYIRKKKFRQTA